jgi:DNA-nicking Smr family endonuclease
MRPRRPFAAPEEEAVGETPSAGEMPSFCALMRAQGVTPLPPCAHVELAPPKKPAPRPLPNRPPLPKAQIDIDDSALEYAPEHYLRADQSSRVLNDLRRGHWPVQDEIDLHGLTREEVLVALRAFLADCATRKLRCVRVIHGKGNTSPGGRAVLKPITRQWLARHPEILAFCAASPHDGGDGALLALLGKVKSG